MFDSVRKHQRVLQFILLLLILPAFVFFGVSGYQGFMSDADRVATVAGERITHQEFAEAQRQQLDTLRQMLGNQVDPKMLDTDAARNEALDGLIIQKSLLAESIARRVTVTDAQLRTMILQIPGLKKPDGTFDIERYRALLSAQNLNDRAFEAQMRRDLTIQAIPGAVAQSAFAPRFVLDRLISLAEEQRQVREIAFRPDAFAAEMKPSDDEARKFYEDNARLFQTPESASVEYLVLDSESLASQVPVDAARIRDFYEQNKTRYLVEEQRQASHILLTVPKDASVEQKAAIQARAADLSAKARGGADFAALAKTQSQDPGSATNGGDLGYFAREMMVKPFADAVFAMKSGEISDPVESEFGFHVIRVTGIKPKAERAFEEVRAEIEAEYRKQEAAKAFAKDAEAFSNMVYEQSDSLKPAAERFKLRIQTADQLGRGGLAGAAPGSALTNPKLLAALFSDDSLKNRRNTEAVETAPNTLVSARVVEHRVAERKPFDAVQGQVRERLIAQRAQEAAVKAGQQRLKALQAGEAPSGFLQPRTIGRGGGERISAEAADAIFRASVDKLPAYVGVVLGEAGYSIFQIDKAETPDARRVEERRANYLQQFAPALAQADVLGYIESLKTRTKITRNLESLSRATAETR